MSFVFDPRALDPRCVVLVVVNRLADCVMPYLNGRSLLFTIKVCPTKKTGTKRQRKSKSDHVPVPGKDPSEEDIERAKELQAIPPPKCAFHVCNLCC